VIDAPVLTEQTGTPRQRGPAFPRRPNGYKPTSFAQNPEAFRSVVGASAQELQQYAVVSFGDRPWAPDHVYGKAARTYRPITACPCRWNRLNDKALLSFTRTVCGSCSSWAETPTGSLLRESRRSYGQRV